MKYDLTSNDILLTLELFFDRLPAPNMEQFEASVEFNPSVSGALDAEAARILDHMGIGDYTCYVLKSDLRKDSAEGRTNVGEIKNKTFYIELHLSNLNKPNEALATMIHEICHNYLKIKGLYCNITREDELRAELCPVFMGFGNVMINGYEEKSGYVKLDDFILCAAYVELAKGTDSTYVHSVYKHGDSISQRMAKIQADLCGLDRVKIVEKSQNEIADFNRLTTAISLTISRMKTEMKEINERQSDIFKSLGINDNNNFRRMLKAQKLANLYKDDITSAYRQKAEQILKDIMSMLYQHGLIDADDETYFSTHINCPACGAEKRIDTTSRLVKCTGCGHIFFWKAKNIAKDEFVNLETVEACIDPQGSDTANYADKSKKIGMMSRIRKLIYGS